MRTRGSNLRAPRSTLPANHQVAGLRGHSGDGDEWGKWDNRAGSVFGADDRYRMSYLNEDGSSREGTYVAPGTPGLFNTGGNTFDTGDDDSD